MGDVKEENCGAEVSCPLDKSKSKIVTAEKAEEKDDKPTCGAKMPKTEEKKKGGGGPCGDDLEERELEEGEVHPLIPIPRPAPTVELRMGHLMAGCNCLKRNGMQHDCGRKDCQGRRECVRQPAPVCTPSGLAVPPVPPPLVVQSLELDCEKKEEAPAPKTSVNLWKVLLNYARAQYRDNPPRPIKGEVPCAKHKPGLYYVRPPHKSAQVQTESEEAEEQPQEPAPPTQAVTV